LQPTLPRGPYRELKMAPETRAGLYAVVVVAISTALAVAFVTGGCGTSTNPEASRLIKEANAHLTNAANQIKGIGDFNSKFSALFTGQASPKASAEVRGLLEAAKQKEQKALDETKAASAALSKVKELKISDNMSQYIGLKLQALGEQEQALNIELEAMDLRISTIGRLESGESFESVLPQEKQINDLELKWAEHMTRAADLNKQASEFYREKRLGK
jgi:hypothetical protein